MDIKKINFKQPKYLLPAIIYLPLLFVGYFIIDMFNVEVSDTTNKKLKTTDYLSSELPEAYTDSILGDKMTNTENQFGRISDLSGVQNVENDNDSVNQKRILNLSIARMKPGKFACSKPRKSENLQKCRNV